MQGIRFVALLGAGLLMSTGAVGLPSHVAHAAGGKTIYSVEKSGKYLFTPAKLTVKAGTKVVFMNTTSAAHTVTSTTSSWKYDKQQPKDAKPSYTFKKAGTYKIICKYHPTMKATIVVTK